MKQEARNVLPRQLILGSVVGRIDMIKPSNLMLLTPAPPTLEEKSARRPHSDDHLKMRLPLMIQTITGWSTVASALNVNVKVTMLGEDTKCIDL